MTLASDGGDQRICFAGSFIGEKETLCRPKLSPPPQHA